MLEISDLTHIYANGTRALDGVTLGIPSGIYGPLGPNGAGKSALMRTIATLQTPTSGGTFAARNVLRFQRRPIHSGTQIVRLTVDRAPGFAGVDPYNKWIDRNSDDNVIAVTGG